MKKYPMRDIRAHGLSKGKRISDFNPDDLDRGIQVEYEHTNRRPLARKIAMDHLTEDPRYYEKLERMEQGRCNPAKTIFGAAAPERGAMVVYGVGRTEEEALETASGADFLGIWPMTEDAMRAAQNGQLVSLVDGVLV